MERLEFDTRVHQSLWFMETACKLKVLRLFSSLLLPLNIATTSWKESVIALLSIMSQLLKIVKIIIMMERYHRSKEKVWATDQFTQRNYCHLTLNTITILEQPALLYYRRQSEIYLREFAELNKRVWRFLKLFLVVWVVKRYSNIWSQTFFRVFTTTTSLARGNLMILSFAQQVERVFRFGNKNSLIW